MNHSVRATVSAIAVLLLLTLPAAFAAAEPPGGGGPPHGEGMRKHIEEVRKAVDGLRESEKRLAATTDPTEFRAAVISHLKALDDVQAAHLGHMEAMVERMHSAGPPGMHAGKRCGDCPKHRGGCDCGMHRDGCDDCPKHRGGCDCGMHRGGCGDCPKHGGGCDCGMHRGGCDDCPKHPGGCGMHCGGCGCLHAGAYPGESDPPCPFHEAGPEPEPAPERPAAAPAS